MAKKNAALGIAYFVAAYWAVGQTIYANKIIIGDFLTIFGRKFFLGAFFGWILIPVAIIKNVLSNR